MDIQGDKDFAALPEVAKLYQACKERDLTIAEREYLKGARDAWQAQAQAVPEGFVLVLKEPNEEMIISGLAVVATGIGKHNIDEEIRKIWEKMIKAQEPTND